MVCLSVIPKIKNEEAQINDGCRTIKKLEPVKKRNLKIDTQEY